MIVIEFVRKNQMHKFKVGDIVVYKLIDFKHQPFYGKNAKIIKLCKRNYEDLKPRYFINWIDPNMEKLFDPKDISEGFNERCFELFKSFDVNAVCKKAK